MIKLRILFVSFLFSSLLVSCSAAQDKSPEPIQSSTKALQGERFESKEGGFSIDIFQAPLQIRNLGSETSLKKGIDVGKQFVWKSEKTLYTIMYSGSFDDNGNPITQTLEEMNSGGRKGILRSQAKLVSETSILLDKYPGTEMRYISAEGAKYIGRNYLVGSVGYQVVGAYSDEKYEAEVLNVLDSFGLLGNKK